MRVQCATIKVNWIGLYTPNASDDANPTLCRFSRVSGKEGLHPKFQHLDPLRMILSSKGRLCDFYPLIR